MIHPRHTSDAGPGRERLRAFSLVELVMVVLIMGVLAAIAVPRFASAAARRRLDNAVQRVLADLRYAQQHALATSATVAVRFDTATESYAVDAPSPVTGDGGYTVVLSQAPSHVYIHATTLASGRAEFDGHGLPSSSGTVTLLAGRFSRTISLTAATTAIDPGSTTFTATKLAQAQ